MLFQLKKKLLFYDKPLLKISPRTEGWVLTIDLPKTREGSKIAKNKKFRHHTFMCQTFVESFVKIGFKTKKFFPDGAQWAEMP
jgi:hypothetical protein